jgi:hypothetical protein
VEYCSKKGGKTEQFERTETSEPYIIKNCWTVFLREAILEKTQREISQHRIQRHIIEENEGASRMKI